MRKSLSQIGFTFRAEGLTFEKALDLHLVSGEIAVLQAEIIDKTKATK